MDSFFLLFMSEMCEQASLFIAFVVLFIYIC